MSSNLTLHNMKFRANSPEHSEEIQRELFRLGFSWNGFIKTYQFKRMPFIFCNTKSMVIFWDDDSETFDLANTYTETTLEELKAM